MSRDHPPRVTTIPRPRAPQVRHPGRRLRPVPPPPPRPDATEDAADRWYDRYRIERRFRRDAETAVVALTAALGDRDATIAALTARVGALGALCAAGWVAAGVIFGIFTLHLLWGL